MKKQFLNRAPKIAVTIILTLAVSILSFALPIQRNPLGTVSIAETVSLSAGETLEETEDVMVADTTLISPAPASDEATESVPDEEVKDGNAETEEKLSFTERVAAKFAETLGKYIPKELVVVIVSMLPILELRAGLFVAKFLDLPLIKAIPLCIVGNIIPIPLILLFIKKIFKWLGKTKLFHKLVEKLESRAMKKSKALANGEFVGLMLFVGIPVPGTGAWMGSLIAALLEVDFKKAIIAELVGIAIATVIVSILSYGLLGLFI